MADWKNSVNLPRTDFPMKANLQVAEPAAIARWESMDLYGQIARARAGNDFRAILKAYYPGAEISRAP